MPLTDIEIRFCPSHAGELKKRVLRLRPNHNANHLSQASNRFADSALSQPRCRNARIRDIPKMRALVGLEQIGQVGGCTPESSLA